MVGCVWTGVAPCGRSLINMGCASWPFNLEGLQYYWPDILTPSPTPLLLTQRWPGPGQVCNEEVLWWQSFSFNGALPEEVCVYLGAGGPLTSSLHCLWVLPKNMREAFAASRGKDVNHPVCLSKSVCLLRPVCPHDHSRRRWLRSLLISALSIFVSIKVWALISMVMLNSLLSARAEQGSVNLMERLVVGRCFRFVVFNSPVL